MSTPSRSVVAVILDGFGLNPNPVGNAVAAAKKPVFDALWNSNPHTTLTTHGERVGLPDGQMGNSEVGHQNIGAGRVVEQWLLRITNALKGPFLKESPAYQSFLAATKNSGCIHVIGLYSDGGVHSLDKHAEALLTRLHESYPGKIALHLITDGRDTSPFRAGDQVPQLLAFLKNLPRVTIATISGRLYAMDRDNRWERVERSYNAIVHAQGHTAPDVVAYIKDNYAQKTTDEFIEPAIVTPTPVQPGDGVVFFNFRDDRMREITKALCVPEFSGFARPSAPFSKERVLQFVAYDPTFGLPFLFAPIEITNHLGEVVSKAGFSQMRIAETEKYPHVTFFFNGGTEQPYPGEERVMIPSPKEVKTYDLKPEMSAQGVADAAVAAISSKKYALTVINFANGDMVGHSGKLEASTKAVEVVDACLGRVAAAAKAADAMLFVFADHGNCEQLIDYQTNLPHTAHTTHPVPLIVMGSGAPAALASGGALCDVAPTILDALGLATPAEMTGKSLFRR